MHYHAIVSSHLILETKHQTCHNSTTYTLGKENLPNLGVLAYTCISAIVTLINCFRGTLLIGFIMVACTKICKIWQQTITYVPNTIFSCQTTLKRLNFWNLA